MFFNISFDGFFNFFLGMATGAIAFTVIFVILLIRGKKMNAERVKRSRVDVDEEELKAMILKKRKVFKDNKKASDKNVIKLMLDLSYELIEEIATYFFPKSKYPMLELNVYELLELNHYFTERVNAILDKPILKYSMNLKVITLMKLWDKKAVVQENKVFQATKKYKPGKIVKSGWKIYKTSDPKYWLKKLTVNIAVDKMVNLTCGSIIGIVGEETTKIYSKELYDKSIELMMVESEINTIFKKGIIEVDEENE